MATHTTTRRSVLAVCATLVLAASACGSDSDADESTDTVEDGVDVPVDTTDGTETGGPSVEPLTAEQICERLTLGSVGAALGIDIGLAEPSEMDTPQCEYSYDADGATSNLTVAAMRPEDVAGLAGAAAYDYVLSVNRSVAGDVDVEEVTLDAGDAATRISGPAVHLGVVQIGDRVVTVIVPAADASGPDVDSLIAKMATTLA
jgi:hypothetical protein